MAIPLVVFCCAVVVITWSGPADTTHRARGPLAATSGVTVAVAAGGGIGGGSGGGRVWQWQWRWSSHRGG
jgi:hypothetical protein